MSHISRLGKTEMNNVQVPSTSAPCCPPREHANADGHQLIPNVKGEKYQDDIDLLCVCVCVCVCVCERERERERKRYDKDVQHSMCPCSTFMYMKCPLCSVVVNATAGCSQRRPPLQKLTFPMKALTSGCDGSLQEKPLVAATDSASHPTRRISLSAPKPARYHTTHPAVSTHFMLAATHICSMHSLYARSNRRPVHVFRRLIGGRFCI
jgi:hypothetical protein